MQTCHLPHHCLLWGFKLKNTASNFISGFSLDSSQSDIYMHFNTVSFHPALCNSLSITQGSINKQRQMTIWNQPLNCFLSPSLTGLLQLTSWIFHIHERLDTFSLALTLRKTPLTDFLFYSLKLPRSKNKYSKLTTSLQSVILSISCKQQSRLCFYLRSY